MVGSPRVRGRRVALATALWLLVLSGAAAEAAEEASGPATDPPVLDDRSAAIEIEDDEDTTFIGMPPFPGATEDWVRLQLGSTWLPDAGLGSRGEVDLFQPEVRLRLDLPVMDLFVLRVNGTFGASYYEFHGGTPFSQLERDDLLLYRTGLSVDAALRINPEDFSLFEEGEVWSIIGRLTIGSDFEGDAFDEGTATTLSAGLGYRNGDRFRIALGAAISTGIEHGDTSVDPVATFRWRPIPELTVSDRGLGLRVAYQLWTSLELFANGYRNSDVYALESRRGDELPTWNGLDLGPDRLDEITFRDRQWLVGAGFEWKHTRAFRINFEAGCVVSRKLRVHQDDLGTLYSDRADPSAYVGLRAQVRY